MTFPNSKHFFHTSFKFCLHTRAKACYTKDVRNSYPKA